ncbi:TRAP transporter small permease subunit [Antarcticimicrobium luteum]|uniref:TRAP transporter small permease protein n=1 Tax=Antarcticimicrobium luteum TaxID=2547397 RepID=A0A4R5V8A4_9RHOB|nr:TRAP transporter small permease subunit [Antarcticimicrobium luteum]TDK48111.1 TRAP transporter small permease subunit [Antarcticimicrobium luteum]
MQAGLKLAAGLTRICDGAARIAAVLIFVLVFVIIYDVIGRKFFATGSFLLQELEWHIHGVIAVFAFGYAYTRNAHVRIDVLAHRMSDRFRLWLEFWVLLLLVIPFFGFIVWYGYEFAERAFVRGEGANGGRGLPYRWIIKSVVPISALLTIAGCVAVALRILAVLRRPDLVQTPFIERGLWKR